MKMRKYEEEKRRIMKKGKSTSTMSRARESEQHLAANYYGFAGFPSSTFVFCFFGPLSEARLTGSSSEVLFGCVFLRQWSFLGISIIIINASGFIIIIINVSGRKEPNEKYENGNGKRRYPTQKRKIKCNSKTFVYSFGRADAVLSAVQLAAERPTVMTLLIFLLIPLSFLRPVIPVDRKSSIFDV